MGAPLTSAVDTQVASPRFREVHSVSSTRVRWLGHRLTADLTIEVDPTATVADGHRLASATERRLVERVRHLDEVHVHVHDRPHSSGESESPHPIEARPD